MEANIRRVAETCRANGVGWRPHTKGQKTPEIIQKELAAGAIGVTCAKLGEAEVLAAIGVRDILIANQIVGPAKMQRLARADGDRRSDRRGGQRRACRQNSAQRCTSTGPDPARGDRGGYRHAPRRRAAGAPVVALARADRRSSRGCASSA